VVHPRDRVCPILEIVFPGPKQQILTLAKVTHFSGLSKQFRQFFIGFFLPYEILGKATSRPTVEPVATQPRRTMDTYDLDI
jgi:hypothetical protein